MISRRAERVQAWGRIQKHPVYRALHRTLTDRFRNFAAHDRQSEIVAAINGPIPACGSEAKQLNHSSVACVQRVCVGGRGRLTDNDGASAQLQ